MSTPNKQIASWAAELSTLLSGDLTNVTAARAQYPPLRSYDSFCPGDGAAQRFFKYRELVRTTGDTMYRMYADGYVYRSLQQMLVQRELFDSFVQGVISLEPRVAYVMVDTMHLLNEFPGLMLVPACESILATISLRNVNRIRKLARDYPVFNDPRVLGALGLRYERGQRVVPAPST